MVVSISQYSDFLPLPRHGALLTALLAPGPVAYAAALQWLETTDFDKIDVSEQRLMPFFYSRLRELLIDHPNKGRIRGLYRRAWYLQQTMSHRLGKILEILEETEATAVLLKGAALARMVYDHPANRPYADLDILVPIQQRYSALSALASAGGVIHGRGYHATNVGLPCGVTVDLHHSPYRLACYPSDVEPLFTRLRLVEDKQSAPANRSGRPLLTLGNADQLLHTIMHGIVHGLHSSSKPQIRWIVDAVLLMRQERGKIDWELFQRETARLAFTEPSIIGLREILRHEHDIDAARVLTQLERRTSPLALEQWLPDMRVPGVIQLWDRTRGNEQIPTRLALVAKQLLEQHGLAELARLTATKGFPYYRKLIRVLYARFKRRSGREGA
jgi:hypothetical protein